MCKETSVYEVPDLGNNLAKNVLTLAGPSDAEVIEQVMSVQGYLVEVNLPPIIRKDQYVLIEVHILGLQLTCHRIPQQRRNSVAQHIVLAAPNSPSFNQSVEAFAKISRYLSTACPTGTLEEWTPTVINGYPTLRLSSRYLSFPDEGDVLDDIPKSIDPNDFLKRLSDTKRRYTTDNVVRYFEQDTADDGSHTYVLVVSSISILNLDSYIDIKPYRIRAGQLVEVQIRFETQSTNPSRHTWFTGRLCTICILNRKYELVCVSLLLVGRSAHNRTMFRKL